MTITASDVSSPGRWELVIPGWRPASVNQLMRSVRNRIRLKKRDREFVTAYALQAGVPPAAGRRRIDLKVVLGPRDREPDPDNLRKSFFDACKHARLIVDDTQQWLDEGTVTFTRGLALRSHIFVRDLG